MHHSIFCKAFPGDDNSLLKEVQEECEEEAGSIYFRPRNRFLRSADLVDFDTELVQRVRAVQSVQTSILKSAYATIAAAFRFQHSDASQQDLGSDATTHKSKLESRWKRFFHSEVDALTEDDEFTLGMINLVTGSPGEEARAREQLEDVFFHRYGDLQHKARKIHRKGKDPD